MNERDKLHAGQRAEGRGQTAVQESQLSRDRQFTLAHLGAQGVAVIYCGML